MEKIFTLYPGKEEFCLLALHGDEWPAREVCLRARQVLNCGAVVFNGKKRVGCRRYQVFNAVKFGFCFKIQRKIIFLD